MGRIRLGIAWLGALLAYAPGVVSRVQAAPPPAQAHSVYPDESVTARDALLRVRELTDAGNMPEALRVLQVLLETESDRMLTSAADGDVYVPVRTLVHEVVRSMPGLLERYREAEGPRAQEQLARGDLVTVERTHLLTSAGMEACLRLAQLHVEAARFEAARLVLEQLEQHPDRTGPAAADAAALARTVADYLPREGVRSWAARWTQQAGQDPVSPRMPEVPEAARRGLVTPLSPAPEFEPGEVMSSALQSVTIEPSVAEGDERAQAAWIFPTVAGETLLVSNGEWVASFDAATLAERWKVTPGSMRTRLGDQSEPFFGVINSNPGQPDDVSAVTVSGGVAVTIGGFPESGARKSDRRVHALDEQTGRVLWSVDVTSLDPRLEETSARGPVVIDGDVAVVAMRKSNLARRVAALYLVGLDLYSGSPRWIRLVSSVGTNPWGRVSTRPDASTLSQGVVYRADDMGVIAAYEAWSGRPRWLRVIGAPKPLELMQTRIASPIPAYEIHTPLVVGDHVYVIESGRGRVLRLSTSNGSLQQKRDASAFAEPRYLLAAGEYLAAVGPGFIATVREEEFAEGVIRLSPQMPSGGASGRAVVSGDHVLTPVDGELWSIDPASPGSASRRTVKSSGTALPVVSGDLPPHLITTDARGMHTFIAWEQARTLLDRRVAANPNDPAPLLTYVELVHRAGESQRVPELADRLLAVVTKDPGAPAMREARARLFTLLLRMVRSAHDAGASSPDGDTAPQITDLALLDAINTRAGRCADSPDQLAAHLFETAWVRESMTRPDAAAEAYQQIILDAALGELRPDWLHGDDDGSSSSPTAAREATRRLAKLLRSTGPGPYAAFDAECDAQLAALASPAPEDLAGLARRYPAAGAAPGLWLRAALAFDTAEKHEDARRALGESLAAAELSAAMGRTGGSGTLAQIAAALAADSSGTQGERLYRTLRRVAALDPSLSVRFGETASPIADILNSIGARLAGRTGQPRLGAGVISANQAIEGWEPLESMVRSGPGLSQDSVVMFSESRGLVGLWAPTLEDGFLRPLWTRPARLRPSVIRVTPDDAVMYWPARSGGTIESIGLDGTGRWRTAELASILEPSGTTPDAGERFPTPLDGQVRPDDLIFSLGSGVLTLSRRAGAAAALDLADGKTLWAKRLPLDRVFELTQSQGCVVAAGARRGSDEGKPFLPVVAAFSLRTGNPTSAIETGMLGDHPRWMRAVPGGDVIVAAAGGLIRFDPAGGAVRWTAEADLSRNSIAGWAIGDGLLVLDGDVNLWRLSLADGRRQPMPIDTRQRLVQPVFATAFEQTLLLTSPAGLIAVDSAGKVIGADTLQGRVKLEPPGVGQDVVAAMEAGADDGLGPSLESYVARLYFFESPAGRLRHTDRVRLFSAPRSFTVLDGKILIGQGIPEGGLATLVLDAPAAE